MPTTPTAVLSACHTRLSTVQEKQLAKRVMVGFGSRAVIDGLFRVLYTSLTSYPIQVRSFKHVVEVSPHVTETEMLFSVVSKRFPKRSQLFSHSSSATIRLATIYILIQTVTKWLLYVWLSRYWIQVIIRIEPCYRWRIVVNQLCNIDIRPPVGDDDGDFAG